jgi:hypothetical protein
VQRTYSKDMGGTLGSAALSVAAPDPSAPTPAPAPRGVRQPRAEPTAAQPSRRSRRSAFAPVEAARTPVVRAPSTTGLRSVANPADPGSSSAGQDGLTPGRGSRQVPAARAAVVPPVAVVPASAPPSPAWTASDPSNTAVWSSSFRVDAAAPPELARPAGPAAPPERPVPLVQPTFGAFAPSAFAPPALAPPALAPPALAPPAFAPPAFAPQGAAAPGSDPAPTDDVGDDGGGAPLAPRWGYVPSGSFDAITHPDADAEPLRAPVESFAEEREAPPQKHSASYTLLQGIALILVAFVLGFLIWLLILRGSPSAGAAGAPAPAPTNSSSAISPAHQGVQEL